MKTWRDFDVSVFEDNLRKSEQGKKLSDEEFERIFPKVMEKAIKELQIKLPCLTCGVKYHLNNLHHECAEEDIWLYWYIKQSEGNKALDKRIIQKLKEKYPLKADTIIFRGINFYTKEEYERFMDEVKTGYVEFPSISSWTHSYKYAEKFARVMQNGTRKNTSLRQEQLESMFKEKKNITGYKGVILAMDVTKRMVLCDISRENIGNMQEKEVILFPGQYQVHLLKEFEREVGKTEWTNEEIELAYSKF